MFKKAIPTLLAALVALVSFPASGSASEYRYYGTLYGYLGDKKINLYVNVADALGHDGWCYVPGDPGHRRDFWSCTISEKNPNFVFDFRKVRGGEQVGYSGKLHVASLWPLAKGDKPYCLPQVYSLGQNFFRKVYLCAYWELYD